MVQGPRWPRVIEKAGLPSAAAAHGRVGTHCPPRNRWQRRTGRSGSWPRPGQHHQLDPIALALVELDTAMSRSCRSVLRCGVEPLAPRRSSACLRCRGPRTLDMDVTGQASLAFWAGDLACRRAVIRQRPKRPEIITGTVIRCMGGGRVGRVRQPVLPPLPADATPIDPAAGLVGGADGGAVLRYGHRAGRKDADRKRNW